MVHVIYLVTHIFAVNRTGKKYPVINSIESDSNIITNLSILCPKIFSINILLKYSIILNIAEFKRRSFKIMNKTKDFSFETPLLSYQVLIHGLK